MKTKIRAGALALALIGVLASQASAAVWQYSNFIATWSNQTLDFGDPIAATVYFPPPAVADAETYHHNFFNPGWVSVQLWCDNTTTTPGWVTAVYYADANCSGSGVPSIARGAVLKP